MKLKIVFNQLLKFTIDDLFTILSGVCDSAMLERRGLKFNWGYKTTIAGTTREQIRRCQELVVPRSTLV